MQFVAMIASLILSQSGGKLIVKDVKVGHGAPAHVGDLLEMDYTGMLTNGSVFDATSKHGGTPFKFTLGIGQVIKGWDRGLVGMKVGGKRHLVIPSDLAYGSQAMGKVIPANSTLVFDVTLKNIIRDTIEVTQHGAGQPIKLGDQIQVHYIGLLKNGTKFDSSYDRRQPLDVTVGQPGLIPGFAAGLIGMKLGEKRTVTIPPDLGYGPQGAGKIPANSTLVFKLELVKIVKRS